VARELAARWGCEVVDTDAEYQRLYGQSVGEAVIDDERAFRVAESQIVRRALSDTEGVVAVGGGALAAAEVRQALADVPTVWLEVGLVDAARRTGLSGARPLSLGNVRGQLHDMLKQRAEVYAAAAEFSIVTDNRSATDVADEIVEWEASL
jgi:shikimate kinase